MKHFVNSERLISLVKERPPIWTSKRGNTYWNKIQRDEAWTEIAAEWVGDDWHGMSEEERYQQISSLKSRWRNIKDNFKRSAPRYNRKSPIETRKKYYYADLLTFLLEDEGAKTDNSFSVQREDDPLASEESNSESGPKRLKMTAGEDVETMPFIKTENWPTETPDDDDESHPSNIFESIVEPQEDVQTTVEPEVVARPSNGKPQATTSVERLEPERCSSKKAPQTGPDGFERELLNILKTKLDTSIPITNTSTNHTLAIMSDPDAMFFLSQLPYIKSLSPTDRLDFRIKVMQLIQSYVNNRGESGNALNENK